MNEASDTLLWIYLCLWSIQSVPQIILNFRLKSVAGLDVSYVAFNTSAALLSSCFFITMYHSDSLRAEYDQQWGENPSSLKEMWFSVVGLTCALTQAYQMIIYERGGQRISWFFWVFAAVSWLSLFGMMLLAVFCPGGECWLLVLTYLSYVIGSLLFVQLWSQLYFNTIHKSTAGFSMWFVLIQFTSVVVLILFFIVSPTLVAPHARSFIVGVEVLCIDLWFFLQHYMWGTLPHRRGSIILIPPHSDMHLYEKLKLDKQPDTDPDTPEGDEDASQKKDLPSFSYWAYLRATATGSISADSDTDADPSPVAHHIKDANHRRGKNNGYIGDAHSPRAYNSSGNNHLHLPISENSSFLPPQPPSNKSYSTLSVPTYSTTNGSVGDTSSHLDALIPALLPSPVAKQPRYRVSFRLKQPSTSGNGTAGDSIVSPLLSSRATTSFFRDGPQPATTDMKTPGDEDDDKGPSGDFAPIHDAALSTSPPQRRPPPSLAAGQAKAYGSFSNENDG